MFNKPFILISAMDDQDRKNEEEYKRQGKGKQASALHFGIASSSYEAGSGEFAQQPSLTPIASPSNNDSMTSSTYECSGQSA